MSSEATLHPAYAGFNPKILGFILDSCERDGHLNEVGQDHYDHFINATDREMQSMAYAIMRSSNTLQRFGQSEDIFDQTKTILKLIALGITAFDDDFRLIFLKPVGEMPDAGTLMRIEKRIAQAVPTMSAALRRLTKNVSRSN